MASSWCKIQASGQSSDLWWTASCNLANISK
jgi:hypothetical protein